VVNTVDHALWALAQWRVFDVAESVAASCCAEVLAYSQRAVLSEVRQ
jgi:hypothetical protein